MRVKHWVLLQNRPLSFEYGKEKEMNFDIHDSGCREPLYWISYPVFLLLFLFFSGCVSFSGCRVGKEQKEEVEYWKKEFDAEKERTKTKAQRIEEYFKEELKFAWPKKDEAYKKLRDKVDNLATKLAEKENEVQTLKSEQANEKLGWQTELQTINQRIGDLQKKWNDDKIALEKTKMDLVEAMKAFESKKKL